jgi:hypothetical protein
VWNAAVLFEAGLEPAASEPAGSRLEGSSIFYPERLREPETPDGNILLQAVA